MIYRAKDEEDALRLANHSDYGLMSSVWTDDLAKGERFAARINAGMSFVNSHMESGPEYPFGGINRSGYGRENAQWALRASRTNTSSASTPETRTRGDEHPPHSRAVCRFEPPR